MKRFREIYGTLKNLVGGEIFHDFLHTTPEWLAYEQKKDHDKTKQLEKESWGRAGAYLLVMGADPLRFESLLQKWQEEFSARKDECGCNGELA